MSAPTVIGFRHTDKGVYSADASDLRLAPGEWPERITASVPGKDELMNLRLITLHRDSGDEITHGEYATGQTKMRFLVWND